MCFNLIYFLIDEVLIRSIFCKKVIDITLTHIQIYYKNKSAI
jgi:hypothetical protein